MRLVASWCGPSTCCTPWADCTAEASRGAFGPDRREPTSQKGLFSPFSEAGKVYHLKALKSSTTTAQDAPAVESRQSLTSEMAGGALQGRDREPRAVCKSGDCPTR